MPRVPLSGDPRGDPQERPRVRGTESWIYNLWEMSRPAAGWVKARNPQVDRVY